MSRGFLYVAIDWCINSLKYLNLVEAFKCVASLATSQDAPAAKRLKASRTAVDVFITLKWIFLASLITLHVSGTWSAAAVWYLLASNVYTYFYHHTWSRDLLSDRFLDVDRIRRRFLSLLLAIAYSICGFAYLYYLPYSGSFTWADSPRFADAIWYSVATSLTSTYNRVQPASQIGSSLSMVELLIMFAFVTIIIGGSIPQISALAKENRDGISQ